MAEQRTATAARINFQDAATLCKYWTVQDDGVTGCRITADGVISYRFSYKDLAAIDVALPAMFAMLENWWMRIRQQDAISGLFVQLSLAHGANNPPQYDAEDTRPLFVRQIVGHAQDGGLIGNLYVAYTDNKLCPLTQLPQRCSYVTYVGFHDVRLDRAWLDAAYPGWENIARLTEDLGVPVQEVSQLILDKRMLAPQVIVPDDVTPKAVP